MINLKIIRKLKFVEILIILFPFIIITGPALPDISAVIIIIFFIYKYLQQEIKIIYGNYWIYIFFILNFWFIFISFFAYDIKLSLIDAVIFIRFILFIIAILYFLQNNNKLLNYLLYSVFFAILFVTIDTLFQFYNYSSEEGFGSDIFGIKEEGLYGRLNGPFKDYIPGSYLSRFYFLLLLLLFTNNFLLKKKIMSNILTIILGIILSTIFFTGEQMSVCTTLMGLTIVFIFYKKYRKYVFLIIMTAMIIIFANRLVHPVYNDYKIINDTPHHEGMLIQKEFQCKDDNEKICFKNIQKQPSIFTVLKNFKDSAYGEIYITSFKMWQNNMLTGIGLNNYNIVCENEKEFKIKDKNLGCVTHPHNFYVQALTESGLVGFLLFIILVLFLLYQFKNFQSNEYKLIGLIVLLVIFWPIMSTGSFLKNGNMIFICFLIGICMHLSKNKVSK